LKAKTKPLLVVEDDQVDLMTIERALQDIDCANPVVHVENGEVALRYLHDIRQQKPCLILLDINMPVMNGLEFLQQLKQDPQLRHFPVVMLTTSEEQEDKLNSFNLGAAGYMAKSVDYQQFVEIMRSIERYWSVSE
jgi:CheY-like chemotaxis protein